MKRRPTSTSAFGVSKRESHDASGFYGRFTPPELSEDSEVAPHRALDKLIAGDARHMDEVPESSVALVVTSPPYFAGKEYETSLGQDGIPSTYLEYLEMLRDVFAECTRKLEPGGRIAINVANLGRRPYRSLSADVISILQDDLRLLLRGEIVWIKQRGSSGSCAWGSFQRPANPVLRDLSERVIVASKGRFDRAVPAKVRARRGLPSDSSMSRDDFMENTLDVWEIPAESAKRVGHPAPFPVELPARLIELYTYRGDLVLDPFAGSGTTAVAAVRSGRHFAGYDLDEGYIRIAEERVAEERHRLDARRGRRDAGVVIPAAPAEAAEGGNFRVRALREGLSSKDIARSLIEESGFTGIEKEPRLSLGVDVDFRAYDRDGQAWCFLVAGGFTRYRGGLQRAEILWRAVGKAAALRAAGISRLVLLAPDVPPSGSPGARALELVAGDNNPVTAVVDMLGDGALAQMKAFCEVPHEIKP